MVCDASRSLDIRVRVVLKQNMFLVVKRELHELPYPLLMGGVQLAV
jgi:hypothetical protein